MKIKNKAGFVIDWNFQQQFLFIYEHLASQQQCNVSLVHQQLLQFEFILHRYIKVWLTTDYQYDGVEWLFCKSGSTYNSDIYKWQPTAIL